MKPMTERINYAKWCFEIKTRHYPAPRKERTMTRSNPLCTCPGGPMRVAGGAAFHNRGCPQRDEAMREASAMGGAARSFSPPNIARSYEADTDRGRLTYTLTESGAAYKAEASVDGVIAIASYPNGDPNGLYSVGVAVKGTTYAFSLNAAAVLGMDSAFVEAQPDAWQWTLYPATPERFGQAREAADEAMRLGRADIEARVAAAMTPGLAATLERSPATGLVEDMTDRARAEEAKRQHAGSVVGIARDGLGSGLGQAGYGVGAYGLAQGRIERTFTRAEVLLVLRAMMLSKGGIAEALMAFERME
jgi:hypothetical protein